MQSSLLTEHQGILCVVILYVAMSITNKLRPNVLFIKNILSWTHLREDQLKISIQWSPLGISVH